MKDFTKPGRFFLGLSFLAFGLLPFVFRDSLKGLMPFPASLPERLWGVYAVAFVFVFGGILLAAGIRTRWAALVAGTFFLLLYLLLDLPRQVASPTDPNLWTGGFELIALCGGAFIAGGPRRGVKEVGGTESRMNFVFGFGPYLLALALIVFGIQHFMYADFVATLVPSWIPGRLFWAYFVGIAFFATALSIVLNKALRLSSWLMAAMFFLWLLVLHGPLVITHVHEEPQWTSFFVALAMGATFLLLAGKTSAEP